MKEISTFIIHFTELEIRKRYLERSQISDLKPRWVDEQFVRSRFNPLWTLIDVSSGLKTTRKFCGYDARGIARLLLGNSYSNTQERKRAHLKAKIASILPSRLFRRTTSTYVSFLKNAQTYLQSTSSMELLTQHITALFLGLSKSTPWILVLEDDSVINSEAFKNLDSLKDVPKHFSPEMTIIHLNSSRDMTDNFTSGPEVFCGIYQINPATSRNASAYLVSRDVAELIVQELKKSGFPENLPIDFLLQVASRHFGVKTYWQDPPMFLQGSETGHYQTNFSGNRGAYT